MTDSAQIAQHGERRYTVRVCVELVVEVAVDADNARDAAHRGASRALDSLEGIGEKPRVLDHKIVSTRATRIA